MIVHFYCMVITSMRYKPVKHIILLITHTAHVFIIGQVSIKKEKVDK